MAYGTALHPTYLVVGVADLKVADNPECVIATYALGSCLGITAYDRKRRHGGLLHALLPEVSARSRPEAPDAMFVDAGFARLVDEMARLGSPLADCEFKVFGGARVLAASDYLSIGARNTATMRRLALEERLVVKVWDVGGQTNRTIQLYLDNGDVAVRMPGRADLSV